MCKRLLCITPDLSRSGAPIALYGLLRILAEKKDYVITVLTYGRGELLDSYSRLIGENKIEILNGLNPTPEFVRRLRNDHNVILLNTAAVYPFLFFFQNTDIPVYWWIHEAPELIEDSFPGFPNPHLLSPNFHLLAPSEGAAASFKNHYAYNIGVLPVPVFEPGSLPEDLPFPLPDERILFLIPAAYTYLKGQDILLSAIRSLPDEYRQRSSFIFCGYSLEKQSEYKKLISDTAKNLDNVIMLEDFPQDTVYALMNRCHCVVAPSRIDTIPLTIVEGMMLNKLCLVSSKTGIAAYIKDCVNGFVFRDSDELVKRLLLIINDYDSLNGIAAKGHEIYNDVFSPAAIVSILTYDDPPEKNGEYK